MQIAANSVVSMAYTLTNHAGEVLDQANTDEPFMYLQGANNIIPGLEEALTGKQKGDTLKAVIPADKAYGERMDEMMQELPREAFAGIEDDQLQVGAQFQAQTNQGAQVITIAKVEGDTITIDGNHPLAGMELTFDVEVLDVREAAAEEIAHGHVHTPGMHAH